MSRSISAALKAHLAQDVTTVAYCWKVTRTDGQVYGFTDHDKDLTVDGVTYLAAVSFDASSMETTSAFNVDNLDVSSIFSSSAITEADLLAGKWDGAEVKIFLVNWADLTQGIMKLRRGWFGEVKTERGKFSVEIRGLNQRIQQSVGQLFSPTCRADLGDSRCTVNLASFTFTGSVDTVTNRRIFSDAALTQADGYFAFGKVTWTSGNNNGLSMEVKGFTASTDTVELQLPMPFDIQVGDTYTIIKGCNRTRTMCHDDFSNVINFRGEPDLPGLDKILQFGKNGT